MDAQPLLKTFQNNFFFQLMVLFALILVGILIGSSVASVITQSYGIDYLQLLQQVTTDNSIAVRNLVRVFTIINQIAMFGLPALLFAFLFYRNGWRFFQFHKIPALSQLVMGIFFLLSIFPLAQTLLELNKLLPLPAWATSMERNLDDLIKGLLVMESPTEFLFSLLTIAILPAICEELMFRGVVQQQITTFTARPVLSIVLTAIIFSAVHGQFEGFLPRLLLGASLGALYYWSKTLWIPILAHAFNNGMQIVFVYVSAKEINKIEQLEPEIPFSLVLISAIFALSIGYLLNKQSLVNKS